MTESKSKAYWKENIRYLYILLAVWFLVSFVAGIMLKDVLTTLSLVALNLGFGLHNKGLCMYLLF